MNISKEIVKELRLKNFISDKEMGILRLIANENEVLTTSVYNARHAKPKEIRFLSVNMHDHAAHSYLRNDDPIMTRLIQDFMMVNGPRD